MKQNYFLKTILITCLFVFILKNENYISPNSGNSPESFVTNIECVVQPIQSQFFNYFEKDYSLTKNINNSCFYLTKDQSNRIIYDLHKSSFDINTLNLQVSSINQIIPILQKKNSWHQSSDEDHLFYV